MKKFSLYGVIAMMILSIIMSGVVYLQKNNFELHLEAIDQKEPLDMSKLEGFTADLQVNIGSDVWHGDMIEDQIKVSYQKNGRTAYESRPELTIKEKIRPEIMKEHMEDVTCSYDITGVNSCKLEMATTEIQRDLVFFDGKESRKVIATSTLKVKDPAYVFHVIIDNPGEENEYLTYDFEKNIAAGLHNEGETNQTVFIQSDMLRFSPDNPILELRDYNYNLSNSIFEIENDVSGIYKLEDGNVKRIIETDFFQNETSALLYTSHRLFVLHQEKDKSYTIQSYDDTGKLLKEYPLDYHEIDSISMSDEYILIREVTDDYEYNIHVLQYQEEDLKEIDTFFDLYIDLNLGQVRYENHRLYQTTLGSLELTIYEGDKAVLKGKITGNLLDSQNLYRNMNGQSMANGGFWNYYMKFNSNNWQSIQLFE